MSSLTELDPSPEAVALTAAERKVLNHPLMSSLAAAATRMKGTDVSRKGYGSSVKDSKPEAWQEDAWDMYDLVGEQRFLVTTLANRASQARFHVGTLPEDPTDDIEVVEDGPAADLFKTMYGQGSSFTQMIKRMVVNLSMPGDVYIIGVPPEEETEVRSLSDGIAPVVEANDGEIDLDTLEWGVYSVSEVTTNKDEGTTEIKHVGKYKTDDLFSIRVWNAHPRHWWQADSPTRSSLPVLRELVGLTMHISAQVDSRLAGAGIFLIPSSADTALRAAAGKNGAPDTSDLSPLADTLMEAMATAISDRSNATALIPIMPVVPDESIEKFRFISFATDLDHEARELRDEAIRRLALGQDCPPELLLGVGGMNHWGAWLVREDVVTTHLEPPLALICDAITTQFLWPTLIAQGMAEEEAHRFVVWYDVEHLIMRPNRADDAFKVHQAGALSDESLRDANGFGDEDAPPADPNDEITKLILNMIRDAPTLVQNPGLAALNEQIRAMIEGTDIPTTESVVGPEEPEEAPAPEEEETSTEGAPPASEIQPEEGPAS